MIAKICDSGISCCEVSFTWSINYNIKFNSDSEFLLGSLCVSDASKMSSYVLQKRCWIVSSQRNPPLRVDVAFRNIKCRFSDIAIVNAIYNLLESCCYRISHLRSVLLLHPFLQIIFSRYSPLDSSTLRSASIVAYSALTVDLLLPRWLESYPFSSYCLLHSLLTYVISGDHMTFLLSIDTPISQYP